MYFLFNFNFRISIAIFFSGKKYAKERPRKSRQIANDYAENFYEPCLRKQKNFILGVLKIYFISIFLKMMFSGTESNAAMLSD